MVKKKLKKHFYVEILHRKRIFALFSWGKKQKNASGTKVRVRVRIRVKSKKLKVNK